MGLGGLYSGELNSSVYPAVTEMNAVNEKPSPQTAERQSLAAPLAPRKSGLRKKLLGIGIPLVVIIGGVLTASWWLTEARYIESTDNAYVQGDIAVLSTRVDGVVAEILVGDNQAVRAGDPLIRIDAADWQVRLDQAAAALAEARASVVTARMQTEQARSAIAQTETAIAQAEAERARATSEANRSSALVAGGIVSRQANENAVANERKAEAARASAEAQRETAQRALAVAEAQTSQAEARVVSAQSQVTLAQNNLAYTVIRAPFDGIAGNRAAQIGARVAPGQNLIAIAPVAGKLFITGNFKETQLAHVKPGDPVRVVADIDSGTAIRAHVDSLSPATGALFSLLPPENATGNFTKIVQRVPVKIVLDDPANSGWMRPGLSVSAAIDTRGKGSAQRGFFRAAFDGIAGLFK